MVQGESDLGWGHLVVGRGHLQHLLRGADLGARLEGAPPPSPPSFGQGNPSTLTPTPTPIPTLTPTPIPIPIPTPTPTLTLTPTLTPTNPNPNPKPQPQSPSTLGLGVSPHTTEDSDPSQGPGHRWPRGPSARPRTRSPQQNKAGPGCGLMFSLTRRVSLVKFRCFLGSRLK